ncbi:MAG: glycosyltransferase family 2 protein [Paracoccaceae bacterium]
MANSRHVLISNMKNEGPFVLEWVAHHRVLGFDAIYVAHNNCTDGTNRLLRLLSDQGYIGHLRNEVGPDEIPQHAGYDKLRATYDIDTADWLMMLDADEFLNVHVGAHKVQDLTAMAAPEIDVIALSGMVFTGAPLTDWQPGRVCRQFTQRVDLRHKGNQAIKSLTRNPVRWKGIHNHHMIGWKGPGPVQVMRGDGTRFTLASDVPIWKQLRNFPSHFISHDLAHYNHYAVKTRDSFMLRRARGRGAVAANTIADIRHSDDYFDDRSVVAGTDTSIARYDAAVTAEMEKMLSHPKIRAWQEIAEARYAAMLEPYRVT